VKISERLALFAAAIYTAAAAGAISARAEDLSEISAKSAVVYNADTGEVLFEKNARQRLPMASTTKIMSALIVLEEDDLDEKFTVDSEAIKIEGSSMGLTEGDKVSLRDLVCGMLLPSGNDAANAAAVRVAGSVEDFVEIMNSRAEEWGLEDTHFVTPSGLDDYTDEHYSTAYDMARLAGIAMEDPDFRAICGEERMKLSFGDPPFDRWLMNTNKLLKYSDDIVGIKTGFTDKAKRCLVSACDRKGAELICVTLNAPDDWNDHMRLYDRCFDFLSEQRIYPPEKEYYVDVVGGECDKIRCSAGTASAVLLNGKAENVTAEIFIEPFVYAPVAAGTVVGRADYYYNGKKLMQTDITALEGTDYVRCAKPSLWEFYRAKLAELFD